mmetsp:Transcript_59526/g.137584  ORF Transcript_59526/g.137584 Transcript_59526/m.137584 type:complete len:193 (+) Transcript_59526:492-1070(+)
MFCSECFTSYLESRIGEGQVQEDELACPTPSCSTPVTVNQVRGSAGPKIFERFLQFRMQLWKPSAEDGTIVECPGAACSRIVVPPDGFFHRTWAASCPQCTKTFCPRCRKESHQGVSCMAFAKFKQDHNELSADLLVLHSCPRIGLRLSQAQPQLGRSCGGEDGLDTEGRSAIRRVARCGKFCEMPCLRRCC